MKRIAFIQARMGSSRLPGKVLTDLCGRTMLERVLDRVSYASLLTDVVVATTIDSRDDLIANECTRLGFDFFRGSETDVLDRFYQACKFYQPDVIVRITADCPLIDPNVIDRVLKDLTKSRADFASNTLERTFPRGLDAEAFSKKSLERAWQKASKPYERTHVTPYIYQNPSLFRLHSVVSEINYSAYRWTVDTPEDLNFIRAIYEHFQSRKVFSWLEVLELLSKEPSLLDLNRNIFQKSVEEG